MDWGREGDTAGSGVSPGRLLISPVQPSRGRTLESNPETHPRERKNLLSPRVGPGWADFFRRAGRPDYSVSAETVRMNDRSPTRARVPPMTTV